MKILLAANTEDARERLRGATQVLGHQVLEAEEASTALDLLAMHHPDVALVVLEWELPRGGGKSVLEAVRADERWRALPILMLLPEDASVRAIEAFQAGASECVSQGATEQDLTTRMLECLSRAA